MDTSRSSFLLWCGRYSRGMKTERRIAVHGATFHTGAVTGCGLLVRARTSQPRMGRMIWTATTITRQAIGTAAKNPRAALQPFRRDTVPDPVGCGTTRYVTTVPITR